MISSSLRGPAKLNVKFRIAPARRLCCLGQMADGPCSHVVVVIVFERINDAALPTTTCSRCCRAVILVVVAIRIIVVMDGWMGGWIGDWMKTFSPTVFVLLCYTSKVWTYRYRINRSRRLRIAGETTTNVTRDREFGRRGNVNKGIFQRCVVRIQSMALMARNM